MAPRPWDQQHHATSDLNRTFADLVRRATRETDERSSTESLELYHLRDLGPLVFHQFCIRPRTD